MPLSMRSRVIQVDRGSRGFGLSLIYRGLDKYEEKETGIFVARYEIGKIGSCLMFYFLQGCSWRSGCKVWSERE